MLVVIFHLNLKCSLAADSENVRVHLKLLLLAVHVVNPKVSADFGQGDIKIQTFPFGRGGHNHFEIENTVFKFENSIR